MFFAFLS